MKADTRRKLSDYKQNLMALTREMESVAGSVRNTKGFQEKQWKADMKELVARIKSLNDKL